MLGLGRSGVSGRNTGPPATPVAPGGLPQNRYAFDGLVCNRVIRSLFMLLFYVFSFPGNPYFGVLRLTARL